MDELVALQVREAPEHRVLPQATRYDVRVMRFEVSGAGKDQSVLEVEASTHHEYVVLRFTGVERFCAPGFGASLSSLRLSILDTSGCPSGSHYIPPVRVGGCEESGFAFWAASVELVSRSPARDAL